MKHKHRTIMDKNQLFIVLVFIVSVASIGFSQYPCSNIPTSRITVCDATPIYNLNRYCGEYVARTALHYNYFTGK